MVWCGTVNLVKSCKWYLRKLWTEKLTSVQKNLAKGRIADLSPLAAVNGFVRSSPHLIVFLWTYMSQPSIRQIGSPVFSQITCVPKLLTCYPSRLQMDLSYPNTQFIGSTWVSPTKSISVGSDVFLHSTSVWPAYIQTDRQTDHAVYDICRNKLHPSYACDAAWKVTFRK